MGWGPERPIIELPEDIRAYFTLNAKELYVDLLNHGPPRLITIPFQGDFDSSQKARAIENPNPKWYSDLYWDNSWFRRDRSKMVLERIIEGKDMPFKGFRYWYDFLYRGVIKDNLIYGYQTFEYKGSPEEEVIDYFELNSEKGGSPEEARLKKNYFNLMKYFSSLAPKTSIIEEEEAPF